MKVKEMLKREDGAAELLEATIIYPTVILFVFVLIYIGLYILQSMSLSAYAQKVALLASREISYPGYVEMVKTSANTFDAFSDASVEGTEDLVASIKVENTPAHANAHAYRYWSTDPISGNTEGLETIAKAIVKKNSIIGAKGDVKVEIKSQNFIVAQYVTVEVEQTLLDFPILSYFGIEGLKVGATATSSVSDTDEFVRNVDFVVDALELLANKLGIDVSKVKEKVKSIKNDFNLN